VRTADAADGAFQSFVPMEIVYGPLGPSTDEGPVYRYVRPFGIYRYLDAGELLNTGDVYVSPRNRDVWLWFAAILLGAPATVEDAYDTGAKRDYEERKILRSAAKIFMYHYYGQKLRGSKLVDAVLKAYNGVAKRSELEACAERWEAAQGKHEGWAEPIISSIGKVVNPEHATRFLRRIDNAVHDSRSIVRACMTTQDLHRAHLQEFGVEDDDSKIPGAAPIKLKERDEIGFDDPNGDDVANLDARWMSSD
jgi:hypothetical protein